MPTSERGLRVAVLGASGYVGGELLRLLAGHPAVGRLRAFSESGAGCPWSDVHPALMHLAEGRFEPADTEEAANWAEVLFLALPHGRSQSLIGLVERADPRLVIDMAADFRVRDVVLYETYYPPHLAPDRLGSFAYGLADVAGERLAGSRRIAAPGCFATATLLALYPLARTAGFVGSPVSFAVTGSSGSGAAPKAATHHPSRAHNFSAYALDGHRHEAEIAEQLRRWTGDASAACTLLTHSAPLVRGIHASLRALVREPLADPLAALHEAFADRPFVRVLDRPPALAATCGTNYAHLHAVARDGGHEVVVTVAIDNLVKGAAGQGVQAMNLALGLPETAGLEFGGISPC